MEEVSVLNYTVDHLISNEYYADAYLIPFEGSDKLAQISMKNLDVNIGEQLIVFKLNIKNYRVRDMLSNNKRWLIISKKLNDIIFNFQMPYESINAVIQETNGERVENEYFAVPISKMKGLVDETKSKYRRDELYPNMFSEIEKLVFRVLENTPQLFRIEERPELLFVREELVKSLKVATLQGVTITPVDKYDWSS